MEDKKWFIIYNSKKDILEVRPQEIFLQRGFLEALGEIKPKPYLHPVHMEDNYADAWEWIVDNYTSFTCNKKSVYDSVKI